MRVALVHDWLTGMRGGERCLQAFLALYPNADIFTLFHSKGSTSAEIDARVKEVSYLGRLPFSERYYRALLPLYPHATKKFDFRGYDLVISLSHAAVKNIEVPRNVQHISYCFTPMRYIWDQADHYLGGKKKAFWPLIDRLRKWDRDGSNRVNHFIGISRFVAARIRCFYGRSSDVIFPPVDTEWISRSVALRELRPNRGEAFLYAGALVPYKRADLVIETFNRLGEPLWVVGTGPLERELRQNAKQNVKFLGHLSDRELAGVFRRCRALVHPGVEDFGMIPVECMAAGRPIIGQYRGGLRESMLGMRYWQPDGGTLAPENATGVFIRPDKQDDLSAVLDAVRFFLKQEDRFSELTCKAQAAKFGPDTFFGAWGEFASRIGIDAGRSRELLNVAYA